MTTPVEQPAQAGTPVLAAGQIWDRPDVRDRWTLVDRIASGPFAGQWRSLDQNGEEGIIGVDDLTCTRVVLMNPLAPPTPAPARERRAGQRWRAEWGNHVDEDVIVSLQREAEGKSARQWRMASGETWDDERWNPGGLTSLGTTFRMTLLADAPATSEPGRARFSDAALKMGCDCAPNEDCATCRPFYDKPARPAQEAAKAELTVCHSSTFSPSLHGPCTGAVLFRHRYNGSRFLCDGHYLAFERRDFEAMHEGNQSDVNLFTCDSVPERLPRPRLTHSAMWADWAEDAQ